MVEDADSLPAGPSPSAESAPVPSPIAGFHVGKIQKDTVGREPKGIGEHLADELRELPIHLIAQPADAANIHKGCITRFSRHAHGRLRDRDHDILLRLPDGAGDCL